MTKISPAIHCQYSHHRQLHIRINMQIGDIDVKVIDSGALGTDYEFQAFQFLHSILCRHTVSE